MEKKSIVSIGWDEMMIVIFEHLTKNNYQVDPEQEVQEIRNENGALMALEFELLDDFEDPIK